MAASSMRRLTSGKALVLAVKEGGYRSRSTSPTTSTRACSSTTVRRGRWSADEAAGKRFLNLFCYTGSFSVYAAAGGAKETRASISRTPISSGRGRTSRRTASRTRAAIGSCGTRPAPSSSTGPIAVSRPSTWWSSIRRPTRGRRRARRRGTSSATMPTLLELVAEPRHRGVVYFSTNFRRFHLAEERLEPSTRSARSPTARSPRTSGTSGSTEPGGWWRKSRRFDGDLQHGLSYIHDHEVHGTGRLPPGAFIDWTRIHP
jgi:hypothetical protein